jgi:hypothetical protein
MHAHARAQKIKRSGPLVALKRRVLNFASGRVDLDRVLWSCVRGPIDGPHGDNRFRTTRAMRQPVRP